MEDSKNNEMSRQDEIPNTNSPERHGSPPSTDRIDVTVEAAIGADVGEGPDESDVGQRDDDGEEPGDNDVGQEDHDAGSETKSYSVSKSQLQTDAGDRDWPTEDIQDDSAVKVGDWDNTASENFGEPSVSNLSGQHLPILTVTR